MQQKVGSLVIKPSAIPGIRPLARMSGVNLAGPLTAAKIRRLEAAWGDIHVVRANPALVDDLGFMPPYEVLELLAKTGTLTRQPLRTVYGLATLRGAVTCLLLGGAVAEMVRRVEEYKVFCFDNAPFKTAAHVALCSPERRHTLGAVGRLVMSLKHVPATDDEVLKVLLGRHKIGTWIEEPDLDAQVRVFARANRPRSVYVAAVANRLHEALAVRRILREEWGEEFDARVASIASTSRKTTFCLPPSMPICMTSSTCRRWTCSLAWRTCCAKCFSCGSLVSRPAIPPFGRNRVRLCRTRFCLNALLVFLPAAGQKTCTIYKYGYNSGDPFAKRI